MKTDQPKRECRYQDRRSVMAAYVTGDLSEAQAQAFEAHYFGCPSCLRDLKILADSIDVIARGKGDDIERPVERTAEIRTERRARRGAGFAAPLALAAVVIIALALPFLVQEKDTTIFDPARFEPSPALESALGQQFRAGEILTGVFPDNTFESRGEPIHFRWQLLERNSGKTPDLELQILDHVETLLYAVPAGKTGLVFEEKLQPGLYYWALLLDGEMIYLGRFFVRFGPETER